MSNNSLRLVNLYFYRICDKEKIAFLIGNARKKQPAFEKVEITTSKKNHPPITLFLIDLQESHLKALKSEFNFDYTDYARKKVTQQDKKWIASHVTSSFNKFAATFYITIGASITSTITTFSLAKIGFIGVTTACSLIVPVALGIAAVFALLVISYRFYKSSQKQQLSASPQTIFNNIKENGTHGNRAVPSSSVMRGA